MKRPLFCYCLCCIYREYTLRIKNLILGHALIRLKADTGYYFIQLLDADILVGINLFLLLVPEQLVGRKLFPLQVGNLYVSDQGSAAFPNTSHSFAFRR